MNNHRRCERCGGILEMIIEKELCACKDCKRVLVKDDINHYAEMVFITGGPIFWIDGHLSLQGPIVFAYFTSLNNEQHYMAGPSMKALKDLTNHINATPKERVTLTIVDEAEVSKLNLRFFNQAKKEVLTYQRTYYLGTR